MKNRKHKKLKLLRISKEYTQDKLAEKLGIDASTYSYKENGLSEFKLSELQKISELLGETVEEIFFAE